MPFRHDDTDGLDEHEFPDPDHEAGTGTDEATETVPCPFCKALVYEDAEWCPHCRNYLFYDGPPVREKPLWLVGGVAACLLVVIYWILRG